jgi:virginiamycin B lyase
MGQLMNELSRWRNRFVRALLLAVLMDRSLLVSLHAQNAGDMWGVNSSNQIFRWNGTGWAGVPGELKYISIGTDGAVWGVNSSDQIFQWTGSVFRLVPNGALKQIAVHTRTDLWGVNASNQIFRSAGAGTGWTQVRGSLKYVSVGGDGSIWGVNSRDEIYRLIGEN